MKIRSAVLELLQGRASSSYGLLIGGSTISSAERQDRHADSQLERTRKVFFACAKVERTGQN
jgi:argininosuccinate lyase